MKMFKSVTISLLFYIHAGILVAQTKCDCTANFQWVKKTFEENDAGFTYALQQKGKLVYDKYTAAIQKKIKPVTGQTECISLLREYLSFFRKSHFSIFANNPETVGAGNTGTYRIAMVKSGEDYKGVIVNAGI